MIKAKKTTIKIVDPIKDLPIPKSAIHWLAISLTIAAGWHIPHTPAWALAAFLVLGGYAYFQIIRDKPLPSAPLRLTLAGASVVGILITYHSYMGRDPGITALIVLSTFKLMELNTRRDFMILVFLAYFLVFGNFLFDQSIEDLAFTLTATILITGSLIRLNHPGKETDKVRISHVLKFSLRLFAFSLPFTIILFFLFPRTTGPLWNLSQESLSRFQSGISDMISPGQIAETAQSNILAFQVEFPNNDMPRPVDLYFRGIVLWYTDGEKWHQDIFPARYRRQPPMTGEGILQRITLQPHNQRWLFGIDRPLVLPRWSGQLPDGSFQTLFPVKSLYRYDVFSRLNTGNIEELTEESRQRSLQLPRKLDPRLEVLAMEWKDKASSNADIVKEAENFFTTGGFVYTLKPGVMDEENPNGDFLFDKRKGFCEHYASAFALLMRTAGVPSRVIVGYQGGQYNEVGKYLEVRQRDAHAWTEVWFEDRGWVRVDPTAWISPERLLYGMEVSETLSAMGILQGRSREEAIENALKGSFFKRVMNFLKQHWDNINYKWDVWIISYDRFRQLDFMKLLGFDHVERFELLIAVLVIIPVLFFILSYFLKRRALSPDPVLKLYQYFCIKMGKIGITRMHWEGPIHFQERASVRFPQKSGLVSQITGLFVRLRYGKPPVKKEDIHQLKKLVRKL